MSESIIRLTDLCDLISVQVAPASQPDAPYLGLEHLEPGRLRASDFGLAADVSSQKSAFESNDVLYGKLRPYLDKAVLADRAGVATTELLVLRPRPDVDPRYLACVVHSPLFIQFSVRGVTGAQHPRTSWAHIREFELPYHGASEQVAIATLLWGIFDLRVAAGRALASARALKQAAMQQLFTRGMRGEVEKVTEIGTFPVAWETVKIRDLGTVVTGTTPPTRDPHNYQDGTIPFVAPGDFGHGDKIERTAKMLSQQGVEVSRPLAAGSTCFVCIGSTIGKVGLTTAEVCATNQQINAVVPAMAYEPRYVFYLLTYWSDHIRRHASPSPVPILSKGAFEAIDIVTSVDLAEQAEIADILEAVDRKIELHRRKQALLGELFRSLLHKVMTGEVSVDDLLLPSQQTAGSAA